MLQGIKFYVLKIEYIKHGLNFII